MECTSKCCFFFNFGLFFLIFVNESRLNDLNYIVNTPTTRKKRQICQVTTQGHSREYKLTVDACDVDVGAVLLQEGTDDSSQYYPTLDKALAVQLSLHLICFIIRIYSCNINPHLVNLWFVFHIVN
jgi:hypothetical protein